MDKDTASPAFIVVSGHDIAERAYEIYCDRGRADGFDREDWLRAERELKTAPALIARKASMKARNTANRRQP